MRNLLLIFFLMFSVTAAAASIECATTFYKAPSSGQGSGAVLGGWAKTNKFPLYITIKNGGASFTAPTDRNGNWAIYFRLLSSTAQVEAWSPETGESSICSSFYKNEKLPH